MHPIHGREPRADTHDQSTKGTTTPNQTRPGHEVITYIGTAFRHAVEFSRSGRTRNPPSRASSVAFSRCTPHNGPTPQDLPAGPHRGSRAAQRESYVRWEV